MILSKETQEEAVSGTIILTFKEEDMQIIKAFNADFKISVKFKVRPKKPLKKFLTHHKGEPR